MKKIYLKLTKIQKEKGIVFTSTLSKSTTEQPGDLTHCVYANWDKEEQKRVIKNLLDDDFFNDSSWEYNIIRK